MWEHHHQVMWSDSIIIRVWRLEIAWAVFANVGTSSTPDKDELKMFEAIRSCACRERWPRPTDATALCVLSAGTDRSFRVFHTVRDCLSQELSQKPLVKVNYYVILRHGNGVVATLLYVPGTGRPHLYECNLYICVRFPITAGTRYCYLGSPLFALFNEFNDRVV